MTLISSRFVTSLLMIVATIDVRLELQEVSRVYLNKFENDITHLFLVILGNN